MSTFTTILLIVIFVLIVSDVFFLWRLYKNIGKKKNGLPDEKYFELKYNINLLKAVSAVLIFLIGFLGFTTYGEIVKNVEKDFSGRFLEQNSRIDSLRNILSSYEKIVDSLKIEENESVENLGDINRKFASIKLKLRQNAEALKYTTKVYIVSNLKFPGDTLIMKREDAFTLFFKDLRTIFNEKLPKFRSTPMVTLEGKGIELDIAEITKDYIRIGSPMRVSYSGDKKKDYYLFDLWIAEPN